MMSLSGPLPERIFAAHPKLAVLDLQENALTGTLPGAWAASQVRWGLVWVDLLERVAGRLSGTCCAT